MVGGLPDLVHLGLEVRQDLGPHRSGVLYQEGIVLLECLGQGWTCLDSDLIAIFVHIGFKKHYLAK